MEPTLFPSNKTHHILSYKISSHICQAKDITSLFNYHPTQIEISMLHWRHILPSLPTWRHHTWYAWRISQLIYQVRPQYKSDPPQSSWGNYKTHDNVSIDSLACLWWLAHSDSCTQNHLIINLNHSNIEISKLQYKDIRKQNKEIYLLFHEKKGESYRICNAGIHNIPITFIPHSLILS